MSTGVIITIVIAAVVVLGAIVVLTTARRTDVRGAGALSRETRKSDRKVAVVESPAATGREVELAARSTDLVKPAPAAVVPFVAPDPEALGVSRRMFFNRSAITLMSASLGAFGASLLAFLWKGAEGGFGSKITAGKLDDVIQSIRDNKGFLYLSEARAWVTEYPKGSISKARAVYGGQAPVMNGIEAGVVALYQKCPHLGCKVPECKTSQWFECPCHGSQYNRVGEKKGGPAPRGMDHFGVAVTNGVLVIDTGTVFGGASIGVNTTGQEAEGPNCVGAGGDH